VIRTESSIRLFPISQKKKARWSPSATKVTVRASRSVPSLSALSPLAHNTRTQESPKRLPTSGVPEPSLTTHISTRTLCRKGTLTQGGLVLCLVPQRGAISSNLGWQCDQESFDNDHQLGSRNGGPLPRLVMGYSGILFRTSSLSLPLTTAPVLLLGPSKSGGRKSRRHTLRHNTPTTPLP
jgi:hypothetical protein